MYQASINFSNPCLKPYKAVIANLFQMECPMRACARIPKMQWGPSPPPQVPCPPANACRGPTHTPCMHMPPCTHPAPHSWEAHAYARQSWTGATPRMPAERALHATYGHTCYRFTITDVKCHLYVSKYLRCGRKFFVLFDLKLSTIYLQWRNLDFNTIGMCIGIKNYPWRYVYTVRCKECCFD